MAVTKHGLSRTPEYRAWQQMRLRCTDPEHAAWANYGGRGITVCDRWLASVADFCADMGSKPSPAHELDRINNDRGYEPGNCQWVLRSENDRNRRNNRILEHAGESMPLIAWAERSGLSPDTLTKRLDAGWDTALALTTPVREKAAKGHAKAQQRHPCADCGKQVMGKRCHACENKQRARTAKALVRALLAGAKA